MCLEYGYEVEFTGVGRAPPGRPDGLGFCSQIGVFHRLGRRVDGTWLSGDAEEDPFSYSLVRGPDRFPSEAQACKCHVIFKNMLNVKSFQDQV